jgi:hypothetical protein
LKKGSKEDAAGVIKVSINQGAPPKRGTVEMRFVLFSFFFFFFLFLFVSFFFLCRQSFPGLYDYPGHSAPGTPSSPGPRKFLSNLATKAEQNLTKAKKKASGRTMTLTKKDSLPKYDAAKAERGEYESNLSSPLSSPPASPKGNSGVNKPKLMKRKRWRKVPLGTEHEVFVCMLVNLCLGGREHLARKCWHKKEVVVIDGAEYSCKGMRLACFLLFLLFFNFN